MQDAYSGSKIEIPKDISKSILQIISSCSVKKNSSKKTNYSRNEIILKIVHFGKGIAHAKSSFSIKNENCKKHVKIHSTNHLELFCEKNRSKKHEIFEN